VDEGEQFVAVGGGLEDVLFEREETDLAHHQTQRTVVFILHQLLISIILFRTAKALYSQRERESEELSLLRMDIYLQ
jgi:hypothetical protein